MKSFKIEIADVVVKINPLYSYAEKYCDGFLTDKKDDFTVSVTDDDILFEKEIAFKINENANMSDQYLETLAIHRKIATEMINYNIVLFHGSAISVDNEGYMFVARSGTGKSTHTKLWRDMLGQRAFMINDDKPLLKISDDGVIAYGTPWNGKHRLSRNVGVPLKAICALKRDETNHIEKISKRDALPKLVGSCYRPYDEEAMMKTLVLLEKMNVDTYVLGCNMEQDAARVSYCGMNERQEVL